MHGRRTDWSYRIRWREQKTDGLELRNTLEGTGHRKGAESAERNEERGEMRNVYRRGERLGLSLCAVPSPRRI